jgi:hypothetical protein
VEGPADGDGGDGVEGSGQGLGSCGRRRGVPVMCASFWVPPSLYLNVPKSKK